MQISDGRDGAVRASFDKGDDTEFLSGQLYGDGPAGRLMSNSQSIADVKKNLRQRLEYEKISSC